MAKKCARREQGSNVVLPSKRDRASALADAVAKKGSCQLTGKGEPQPPGHRKKGAGELKAKASLEGEPRWSWLSGPLRKVTEKSLKVHDGASLESPHYGPGILPVQRNAEGLQQALQFHGAAFTCPGSDSGREGPPRFQSDGPPASTAGFDHNRNELQALSGAGLQRVQVVALPNFVIHARFAAISG